MSVLNQKTIRNEISFKGIGLHSGKEVNLKLLPSKPNSGIVFKRTDLKNQNIILPGIYNVSKNYQYLMQTLMIIVSSLGFYWFIQRLYF